MNTIKAFLRKREWSMGHGQCPDCLGKDEHWARSGRFHWKELGHTSTCQQAAMMEDVGMEPAYIGKGPEILPDKDSWEYKNWRAFKDQVDATSDRLVWEALVRSTKL